MRHYGKFVPCFVFCLNAVVMHGQNINAMPAAGQASAVTAPVAYVYVSSTQAGTGPIGTRKNQINAFAAAANGKLTPVPGSPFKDDVVDMAVNGIYLFGSTRSDIYVAAFQIQPNGALKWTTSTNMHTSNGSGCGGNGPLVLDHTGASLYSMAFAGDDCTSEDFQAFEVDKSSGFLNYVGTSTPLFFNYGALTFRGDNKYAYQATCSDYRAFYDGVIDVYHRQSNGMLERSGVVDQIPYAKSGDFYCADIAAADPTNHVAVEFQVINSAGELPDGKPQLATYSADSSGNLSTTSARTNMPTVAVQYVYDMKMSPSGKLLAVGGSDGLGGGGLQIFHFNGADPIKPYTGLLTKVEINRFFWDNANHLYAISAHANKLYVFTVTPTSISQAPGSPYTITNPNDVIVQPKTPTP
jgi:WD40 repeat protein